VETIVGLSDLNDARSIRDVDHALDRVSWNENVIAADDRGNIGYWHPGLQPLRPKRWDERLPYPGTGEAEWRGYLGRNRRPQVINPKRGWLAQWNNVPSIGWTNGDGPARERLSGPLHRVGIIERNVRRVHRRPTHARSRNIVRTTGTTAQQRPLYQRRLKRLRRGATGRAAEILDALLAWDGSYHRTDAGGTVDPGVAIWEQFKAEAQRIELARLGGEGAELLAGAPGSSHQFDISNGEARALLRLPRKRLRQAAVAASDALTEQFGSADIATWREPRRLYELEVQGAASPPENFPFFDRGTWEHAVTLGP
jgi:acyl-homoserine lactone acylase PvdQ